MRLLGIAAFLCSFGFLASAQQADDSGGVAVTPEPSMVAAIAVGLAGVGVVAWRRNRKR
ncbi:MAG TPA: PEP-CTERM sorting domain-containing protein [Bryobacteraceae bacterium]|nr:PEP-CTERM sorting domain-containing protein [Bryobacteraceae bacterium]